LRNSASDSKLFENASRANTVESYRQYLGAGRSHVSDVIRTRLPRAELAEAARKGTVEALLEYEAAHPSTDIASEIAAAKRKAYLVELEKAKAAKSLAALVGFREKYPKHGLESELQGALHELFLQAQTSVGKKKGVSADAAAFLTKLIGYVEMHGPNVELRFRHRDGTNMAHVDKDIAKMTEYMGEISHPTRYFDAAHTEPRHKVLPAITVPTLFVTTSEDWSGHTYLYKKPRGAFIGVNYTFEVEFLLPKDSAAYKPKWAIFRPVSNTLIKELETAPRTNPPVEETVYETMATEARKQFTAKFSKGLLGDIPEAQ
jgi:hypothetical protein